MAEQDEPKVKYKWAGREGQGFIPGVPARDLTAEDWKDLSATQKRDVKGSALYREVAAEADAPRKAEPKPEPKAADASKPADSGKEA